MSKELRQTDIVTDFTDNDQLLGVFGNTVGRTTIADVKKGLIKNNDIYLNQVAFYIDVNEPADTPSNVNVGGNMEMFRMWVAQWKAGVMDQDGNFAELSRVDNRYFADGSLAVDLGTGEAVTALANANFMGKIPKTGCYIQTVEIAGSTIHRLWLSLLDLPGWSEPEQYVGMFKAWQDESGRLRSMPNKEPTIGNTVKQFWDKAQLYGKSYGLAGVHFRNMLLWYMMAAYGQRGSQECKLGDNTPVWGVGLDGTESVYAEIESGVVTGKTLSLGTKDGKADALEEEGMTCHSVKVLAFENPWGQLPEVDGHMCSIGNDVVIWRENFMPSATTPILSDFANIKTFVAPRHLATIANTATTAHKMNLIALGEQAAFMFPYATQAGVSYNDNYAYRASGQLWLWGGSSMNGEQCGLAYSSSFYDWSPSSYPEFVARLAYFGDVTEVSGGDLLV